MVIIILSHHVDKYLMTVSSRMSIYFVMYWSIELDKSKVTYVTIQMHNILN